MSRFSQILLSSFFLLANLVHPNVSDAQTYNDFTMLAVFTDQNGNNENLRKSVCRCDDIYLKNKSTTTNNFPIGNGLTTGTYRIINYLTNQQIANIPAADWRYNEVIRLQMCNNFSGSGLNLQVTHFGPGINSGIRQRRLYLIRIKQP